MQLLTQKDRAVCTDDSLASTRSPDDSDGARNVLLQQLRAECFAVHYGRRPLFLPLRDPHEFDTSLNNGSSVLLCPAICRIVLVYVQEHKLATMLQCDDADVHGHAEAC